MGNTMGTTYSIKFSNSEIPIYKIQKDISDILDTINNQMSTYKSDSEISIFNKGVSNLSQKISSDFYYVLDKSKYYYDLSNGFFDVTVEPLSEIWGFSNKDFIFPKPNNIDSVLNIIGFDKIKLLSNNVIVKNNSNIKISLNAIAKGYAVDKIAEYFENNNVYNYMVEIGGEVRTKGLNSFGEQWKIGLSSFELEVGSIINSISISSGSLATSGDYRNFIIHNNKSYSHVINPITGYPTENNVVSATVIADYCIDADALATLLNIMDVNSSLELINKLDSVECFIIQRDGNEFNYYYSENMKKYIN